MLKPTISIRDDGSTSAAEVEYRQLLDDDVVIETPTRADFYAACRG